MPNRATGIFVGALGLLCLVFYLVVRLFFMQELDAAVAGTRVHDVHEILANLSLPLLVFLAWAYSFRVGMLLVLVGAALRAGMGRRELWLLAGGGLAYLATCYLPLVGYVPGYYGLLGTLILVLFVGLAWEWMRKRPTLPRTARVAADLRMIGYYFLVVATWGLCGIFGIVTYALTPETMIARGLRPTALMLTSHVMAELALGWALIFAAAWKESRSDYSDAG